MKKILFALLLVAIVANVSAADDLFFQPVPSPYDAPVPSGLYSAPEGATPVTVGTPVPSTEAVIPVSNVTTPEVTMPSLAMPTVEGVNTAPTAIGATPGIKSTSESNIHAVYKEPSYVPAIEKKRKYPVSSNDKINEYFESHKKLIQNYMGKVFAGKPKIGMNSEMLTLIYGEPLRKVQKQIKKSIVEVWIIENENSSTFTILGIQNDKVAVIDNNNKVQDPEQVIKELSK